MFEHTEYSWLIFGLLTAAIYAVPTIYRIWKVRRRKASMSRHPAGKAQPQVSALLGVVYPTQSNDQDKEN
jgi:predicted component of type VI protein secretion system